MYIRVNQVYTTTFLLYNIIQCYSIDVEKIKTTFSIFCDVIHSFINKKCSRNVTIN